MSVDDKEYQTLNFNRPYWLGQIAYACNRCMSVGGNPDGKDTPQTIQLSFRLMPMKRALSSKP